MSSVEKTSAGAVSKPKGYRKLLEDLKARVRDAQTRAAVSVNRELILLYWQIGRDILSRQEHEGWGAKVIDQLAADLRREFPGMRGLSSRNLKYMRALAQAYPDEAFVQQAVAQLPWGHNVRILDKVKGSAEREWYIRSTIQDGWSRNVLVHQIESGLVHRQGRSLTNFDRTLPATQSELAQQITKDPYNFEFLTVEERARERDLHSGLLKHLREFLTELGVGFAFVGSEYHLEVGEEDFYLDLLFYHLGLRCYVVIELKMGEFKPEHAGKMNFYLSAVDDVLRHTDDQPSIGIILCKTKRRVIVEYSLRDTSKPIGVSGYQVTEMLPEKLRGQFPTVAELEAELAEAKGEGGGREAEE